MIRICRLMIPLLCGFVLVVRGQLAFLALPAEDDFVDVQFDDCKECEHNFHNMVFILKNTDGNEQPAISIYSIIVLIMWFCLGVLVALQRWRKMKAGAYHAYERLR